MLLFSPCPPLLLLLWVLVLPPFLLRAADVDPTQLAFHRQSVRRFVFGQEIPFGKLLPGDIIAPETMHPTFAPGDSPCVYRQVDSTLEVTAKRPDVAGDSSLYVSGVQPYALYRLDVRSISPGASAGIELASLDGKKYVQFNLQDGPDGVLDLTCARAKSGEETTTLHLSGTPLPPPPFRLCVQLSGTDAAAFLVKDGQTHFLARSLLSKTDGDPIDFRARATLSNATFNIVTHVPPGGKVVLGEAAAALSSGMGQADIRQITHADGAPFVENNRFWFTISSRGIGLGDSCQAVLSLDPSVFEPRLEGIIVFDRGDGLLRNDYASHVFYDDDAREWRAVTCCFSADEHGRGSTGLAFARSPHDPRRGFSVMSETPLAPDQLSRQHEDPCLIYDTAAGKWRLLTTCFEPSGLRAELFESDRWDGTYTKIAGPVAYDSTGTLIQTIGSHRYCFSGSAKGPSGNGAIIAYSYPDLQCLGEMKFDLPVTRIGGRIWPGIFPVPPGYPARYMALTMDRANFPDVTGPNWSYGALYLFQADPPDLSVPYEFEPAAPRLPK